MHIAFRFALTSFAILTLSVASGAAAGEITLRPRYQPGDAYVLSLHTAVKTAVHAKGLQRKPFDEDVQLEYGARVVVLEVDADGRPVRERHDDVRLAFVRPDESGALFQEHASFEVRRSTDGDVQLFANEKRMPRAVEKVVADVLASQFEYSLGPALFEPGRPVAIGESWELDPSEARRFLRDRGVRVIDLDGPATATLEQRAGDDGAPALVIRYRIPVGRWQPDPVHPNSLTAASDGVVDGEIELAPGAGGRPVHHASNLEMHVNGVVTASRVADPVTWRLEMSRATEQSTQVVKKAVAANF
jgi:hypothetical protein